MTDVRVSGPLFDGRAEAAVEDFLDDARQVVAARASNYVHEILDRDIRNPTPYYETQVTVDNAVEDLTRVHDRGIVYGPWLEGVSEKNQTTRFKGYSAFARATKQVEAEVPELIAPARARLDQRLDGAGGR